MRHTEIQSIALVNLRRQIERKKVERMQKNLHMIDFEKSNTHIKFVEDVNEIKGPVKLSTNHTDAEIDQQLAEEAEIKPQTADYSVPKEKRDQFIAEIRHAQSENKKQYKKLADALVKEEQLRRVSEALTLDKLLKQKGKKRKVEDKQTGQVSYRWFNERKK